MWGLGEGMRPRGRSSPSWCVPHLHIRGGRTELWPVPGCLQMPLRIIINSWIKGLKSMAILVSMGLCF